MSLRNYTSGLEDLANLWLTYFLVLFPNVSFSGSVEVARLAGLAERLAGLAESIYARVF